MQLVSDPFLKFSVGFQEHKVVCSVRKKAGIPFPCKVRTCQVQATAADSNTRGSLRDLCATCTVASSILPPRKWGFFPIRHRLRENSENKLKVTGTIPSILRIPWFSQKRKWITEFLGLWTSGLTQQKKNRHW